MGQFKPMVKMETTEPSVILKLKKGGHVASKHEKKEEHGHMGMHHTEHHKKHHAEHEEHSEHGESPKKPSMSERRKAMSGALLNSKHGGKVEKKAMGGMMGAPAMAAPAVADPRKMAMMKALMARKAAMGGGSPPSMSAPTMPLANANPMTPGSAMKKGGKAMAKGDKAQDKAMIMKAFKEHDAQEHKGGKGTKLKLATGGVANGMKTGGKVSGAAIDKDETKTTIEGNVGKFAKTKREREKTDPGYERYAAGGTIEGNAKTFEKTKMVEAKKDPGYENFATGGVANGMKKGGSTKKHFATGGAVNTGRAVAMPKHLVSQPISNSRQSGTFKKGGVVKKADGGVQFAPDQDMGDVSPKDVADAKARAKQSAAIEDAKKLGSNTDSTSAMQKLLGRFGVGNKP